MTILMGLVTNRAFAIAPGMGLNAVVAFSLVLGQGLSFESAMGTRRARGRRHHDPRPHRFPQGDLQGDPLELKKAIVIGIGFFILFIGLVDGGLIIVERRHAARPRGASAACPWAVAVTVVGVVVTIIMLARKWRAAILLGIVFSTIFAIVMNYV